MEPETVSKISSVRTERHLQFTDEFSHLRHAVASEKTHNNGMILSRLRQTTNGNITISYCFDFEDATLLGDLVKGLIDRFQQDEDLRRLANR